MKKILILLVSVLMTATAVQAGALYKLDEFYGKRNAEPTDIDHFDYINMTAFDGHWQMYNGEFDLGDFTTERGRTIMEVDESDSTNHNIDMSWNGLTFQDTDTGTIIASFLSPAAVDLSNNEYFGLSFWNQGMEEWESARIEIKSDGEGGIKLGFIYTELGSDEVVLGGTSTSLGSLTATTYAVKLEHKSDNTVEAFYTLDSTAADYNDWVWTALSGTATFSSFETNDIQVRLLGAFGKDDKKGPVPEPSSVLLLSIGLLGLGSKLRKRK